MSLLVLSSVLSSSVAMVVSSSALCGRCRASFEAAAELFGRAIQTLEAHADTARLAGSTSHGRWLSLCCTSLLI